MSGPGWDTEAGDDAPVAEAKSSSTSAPPACSPPQRCSSTAPLAPQLSVDIMAELARSTWIQCSRALDTGEQIGAFLGRDGIVRALFVAQGIAPGAAAWAFGQPPRGAARHLVTREDARRLQGGWLDADGAVLHLGGRSRLVAWFDGMAMNARTVPA